MSQHADGCSSEATCLPELVPLAGQQGAHTKESRTQLGDQARLGIASDRRYNTYSSLAQFPYTTSHANSGVMYVISCAKLLWIARSSLYTVQPSSF